MTDDEKRAARNQRRRWLYANNPEVKKQRLAHGRAWAKKNKARAAELMRIWRAKNPERAAAIRARYAERHPDAIKEHNRKQYHADPKASIERAKKWRAANTDKVKAKTTERRKRERERINEQKRAYYARMYSTPEGKRRIQEANKEWQRKNPEKFAMCRNERRARRSARERAVKWADKEKIRAVYAAAREKTRETGIRHEVDHIVPLGGKNVCGLHVENNLRVVPASVNRRKSAKWSPEHGVEWSKVESWSE